MKKMNWTKTTKKQPEAIQERMAKSIASTILKAQLRWANWMSSCFQELSTIQRKILLLCFAFLSCAWLMMLLFGKSPMEPYPEKTQIKSVKRTSILPSDSLVLMEHIYKTFKK